MTTKKKRLLVVDDEEGLRKAIEFEFVRKGFEVLTADCGTMAMEILAEHEVDIVISDVRMPNGTGIDLLNWINSNRPQMPCLIFITAFADLSIEDAYDLGAAAILSKPFDRAALREAVNQCLVPATQRWSESQSINTSTSPLPLPATEKPVLSASQVVCPQILHWGRGGAFFGLTSDLPAVGADLHFNFPVSLGNANTIELKGAGIVRWVRLQPSATRTRGFGIEFTFLSDRCREPIADWIKKQNHRAYIPAA